MHLVDQLPPDSIFMTLGVGADETRDLLVLKVSQG